MARLTPPLTERGQDNEGHTSAWSSDYCPSLSESNGTQCQLVSQITVADDTPSIPAQACLNASPVFSRRSLASPCAIISGGKSEDMNVVP